MAQRRPHGDPQLNKREASASAWRAGVLEQEHEQRKDGSRRRDLLDEFSAERFYSEQKNPAKRERSTSLKEYEELRKRSAERIRMEQERRTAEERAKVEKKANPIKTIPQRSLDRQSEPRVQRLKSQREKMPESKNKPRQMSEGDLQNVLQQVRKERREKQLYEELRQQRKAPEKQRAERRQAEQRRKPQPESDEKATAVRKQSSLVRKRTEEQDLETRRAEYRRRQKEHEAWRAEQRSKAQQAARRRAASEEELQEKAAAERRSAQRQAARKPKAKQVPQRKAKKQKKVFTKGFKKGFLIAWGAFVLILIVAMAILWSFLNRYEKGLPEHAMSEIVEDLQSGELDSLHLVTDEEVDISDPSIFGATDTVASFLQRKNEENTLRYVKVNAESTENENVYMIRSGDENLLKVYLTRPADGKKRSWEEKKTMLASDSLKVRELLAQIPSSASLQINGKTVERSFISESGSRIQLLVKLMDEGFIGEMPTVDTYTVRGIFASPEVVMVNESGAASSCTLIGEVYTAGFDADDAFVQEQTERVMSLFEPYALYFSGDAGKEAVARVMLDNSPAADNALAADVSWMQEHDGIQLSEQSVSNIKKYSDDCYSCDIHFKQDIMRGGESVRTWDTNMTWIMVKDGDYYLADLLTKTAED